jgi:hypothetical protein
LNREQFTTRVCDATSWGTHMRRSSHESMEFIVAHMAQALTQHDMDWSSSNVKKYDHFPVPVISAVAGLAHALGPRPKAKPAPNLPQSPVAFVQLPLEHQANGRTRDAQRSRLRKLSQQ